jgi:predicted ArsR family transcriptional regulator
VSPPRADRRGRVLEALRSVAHPTGASTLAEELGMPVATVRFHLGSLVADGVAERVHAVPAGPGRPPVLFAATRGMDPHGPTRYRVLAGVLVGALAGRPDAAAEAVEAGRAWAAGSVRSATRPVSAARALSRTVALLDDLGFAPSVRTRGGRRQVALGRCPFLDLATTNTEVVCSVHLGIMQGALARMAAPVGVERLEPFAEPGRCVAHLVPTGETA